MPSASPCQIASTTSWCAHCAGGRDSSSSSRGEKGGAPSGGVSPAARRTSARSAAARPTTAGWSRLLLRRVRGTPETLASRSEAHRHRDHRDAHGERGRVRDDQDRVAPVEAVGEPEHEADAEHAEVADRDACGRALGQDLPDLEDRRERHQDAPARGHDREAGREHQRATLAGRARGARQSAGPLEQGSVDGDVAAAERLHARVVRGRAGPDDAVGVVVAGVGQLDPERDRTAVDRAAPVDLGAVGRAGDGRRPGRDEVVVGRGTGVAVALLAAGSGRRGRARLARERAPVTVLRGDPAAVGDLAVARDGRRRRRHLRRGVEALAERADGGVRDLADRDVRLTRAAREVGLAEVRRRLARDAGGRRAVVDRRLVGRGDVREVAPAGDRRVERRVQLGCGP